MNEDREMPGSIPAPSKRSPRRAVQALKVAASLGVVAAVFFYALPQVADFSDVWQQIGQMSALEVGSLAALAAWNLATYWFVMVESLPGSNLWQAMKVNGASTAVANTLPGGGALGIGVTYGMYVRYGFPRSSIGLSLLVSGIWNNFVKLGMPVLALALLALEGGVTAATLAASLAGVGALAAAIASFALVLRSEAGARNVGDWLGRLVAPPMRLLRRSAPAELGAATVRFRRTALDLLRKRRLGLTIATLVSHVSLYLVLLVSLRHVGASAGELTWIEVLASFAFIRLVSALPVTPGGLGVVELGYTAALVAAGGQRAEVVAGVLVFRALTYLLPIPWGLATYLKWKRGAARRLERLEAPEDSQASPAAAEVSATPGEIQR